MGSRSNTSGLTAYAPHSPDKCAELLDAAIERDTFLEFYRWKFANQRRPVAGRVSPKEIRLRKATGGRNSFRRHLFAELRPDGEGTRIDGNIAVHPIVHCFMIIWFLFIALFAVQVSWPQLVQRVNEEIAVLPILGRTIPFALMMLMGFLIYWIGKYASRDDEDYLREFLTKTIGAQFEPHQENR